MNQTTRSLLHIVAHQDDDLYFMNPDLVRSLQDGDLVTTVVLTAGEGDGINADTNDPERAALPPDFTGYSTERGCGLRSAYARMATGDRDSPWRREPVDLVPGFAAERFTLADRDGVYLYFLQLHQGAPTDRGRTRVHELWEGALRTQATLPARGCTVGEVQHVTREQVVGALTALLAHVRPTVVRTMDPDPEHDGGKEEYVCSDHVDHTATAHFALAALTRHREAGHTPVVEHYRAYANRFWGYNLDSAAVSEKAEYLATYAGLDAPQSCPHGTCERCGDRQLGPNPFRSTHMRSAAYRYSPTTDWLRLGPDGRLNAFGVLAGRLAFWTETAPASGEWKGPFVLGDGWLAPTLAVTGVPGGPAELVGLRRQSVVGSGVTVDVVHTVQDPDGNGFSGWRTLENPDWSHGDGRRQREVGVPSAAVDGMGRLHVFVRDFAQGISLRRRDTTGAWTPWENLGGSFVQDAGTALTTQHGTVELYVPGKNTVWRWYQPEPGGPFTLDDTLKTGRPATGGITAVDSGAGRTCLYYREAGTQQVMAYRQHADGRWPGSGAGLGGHGGTGAVAALWAPERGAREAFLAHRGSRGRPVVSLPDRDKDISGTHWRESGDMFTHAPAMARDAAGAVVLAVIGTDGHLHVRRQLSPAAGSPLGPWR
ncbi:PIG-L family deacetylase [Streptomyces sp. NPDC059837]|jgi:LmbE family N-acetylglucosaminyl deacetylase|uniref:PIG-L family deacetylase n=1 Tax=unclassified Streptomyces TaxID=2593676 RepID=UPI0022516C2C|nr:MULTISPECIES: PIG-L family deacetylase [unclassified Streptomyces]MCX4407312.1 PIG-L family deacetylase [Streptomyces sp. NBC_01764]MCX5093546.1 PIG-L family deacetylase [Streptomyces sp. NBC_00365]MCX5187967.1 PIG-L family deacetylase [Streptomyces sp. NBC_00268]